LSKCQNFGVSGWIIERLSPISADTKNFAVAHDDCAYGNFAKHGCLSRFYQSQSHSEQIGNTWTVSTGLSKL